MLPKSSFSLRTGLGLVAALWISTLAYGQNPTAAANPQGGNAAPGGQGGPGGPGGGRGGPGGPGGRGGNSSTMAMLLNEDVQKDLKLDEKQVAKIKDIQAKSDKTRTAVFAEMQKARDAARAEAIANGEVDPNAGGNGGQPGGNGGQPGGGRGGRGGQNGQGGGNNQANAQDMGGGQGGGPGGFGGPPGGFGGGGPGGFGGFGGGGPGGGGPGGPGGGGPGGGWQNNPMFEQMRASMTQLQQDIDSAIAAVLKPAQKNRLEEIRLRIRGMVAAMSDPMILEKLNIRTPEQKEQIKEVLDGRRQYQNEIRQASRTARDQKIALLSGDTGQRPDREKMRLLMQTPEMQELQKREQDQTKSVEDRTIAALTKVLSKGQRSNYEKMLGAPFDVEKYRTGRRPPGAPDAPGTPAATATAAAGTKPAADASKPAATATPAKKSLSDRRKGK